MTERHGNSFEIDVSGALQDVVAAHDLRFVPHHDNLQALAKAVGTPIPEEPRVLLLAQGQLPHTDRMLVIESLEISLGIILAT